MYQRNDWKYRGYFAENCTFHGSQPYCMVVDDGDSRAVLVCLSRPHAMQHRDTCCSFTALYERSQSASTIWSSITWPYRTLALLASWPVSNGWISRFQFLQRTKAGHSHWRRQVLRLNLQPCPPQISWKIVLTCILVGRCNFCTNELLPLINRCRQRRARHLLFLDLSSSRRSAAWSCCWPWDECICPFLTLDSKQLPWWQSSSN